MNMCLKDRMMRWSVFAIVMAMLCMPGAAMAAVDEASARQRFDAGQARFDEGVAASGKDEKGGKGGKDAKLAASLFAEAAAQWDAVRQMGVINAGLETNIGNARLLSGDAARAMAAYRRALLIEPGRKGAVDGLADAARRLGVPADGSSGEVAGEWGPAVGRGAATVLAIASPARLVWVAGVMWVVGWGLVVWRVARRGTWVRAWHAAAAWIVAACAIAPVVYASGSPVVRAVVVRECVARNGPSETIYAPAFEGALKAGSEVRVMGAHEGWCRVVTGDGREAWVMTDVLEPSTLGAWPPKLAP